MPGVMQPFLNQDSIPCKREERSKGGEARTVGKNGIAGMPRIDGEAQEAKTGLVQERAHLFEERLAGIDLLELGLEVDKSDIGDAPAEPSERGELGALDVHPEQIDARLAGQGRLEGHRFDLDLALLI